MPNFNKNYILNCLNPTAKILTVLNSKAFYSCLSFLALEILCHEPVTIFMEAPGPRVHLLQSFK